MSWEDFYLEHLPPSDFEDTRQLLKEFCDRHKKLNSNIVLVTVSRLLLLESINGCFAYESCIINVRMHTCPKSVCDDVRDIMMMENIFV